MRKLLVLTVLVFLGAFAIGVGSRIAAEGRALVAGMVIGVVTSVPAALITVVWLRRQRQQEREQRHPPAAPRPATVPPSVVIVNPGQAARSVRYNPYGMAAPPETPQPRRFTIVGGDENGDAR